MKVTVRSTEPACVIVDTDIEIGVRINRFSDDSGRLPSYPHAWGDHPDRPWFVWGRYFATPDAAIDFLRSIDTSVDVDNSEIRSTDAAYARGIEYVCGIRD
jgi:hypothetical protein